MARVVLLSFEDNATADSFVRQVVTNNYVWQLPPSGDVTDGRAVACKVEAVVAKPTKGCRCSYSTPETRRRRTSRSSKREQFGWSRSLMYGWWVCGKCGRTSPMVVRHFVSGMLHGANDLLPKILRIGDPISPHNRWLADGGYSEAKHHDVPQQTEF